VERIKTPITFLEKLEVKVNMKRIARKGILN